VSVARNRFRQVRGQRRLTQWIDTGAANDTGYVSIAINTLAFFSLVSFTEKATLARVRGIVLIVPEVTASAQLLFGAYGLIVVKTTAAGVGVTALPDPLSDPQEDWYAHGFYGAGTRTAVTDGVKWQMTFPWDSKAMRKVGPDESSVLMISNGGSAARVASMTRELVMLS